MNQDLEALIKAYLAVRESTGRQRDSRLIVFEELLDKALVWPLFIHTKLSILTAITLTTSEYFAGATFNESGG